MSLIQGALVSFAPTFIPVPVPNVTIFQFNPESVTHTWSQPDIAEAAGTPGRKSGNPQAVPGLPGEEFSLTIYFDAQQDIADNVPVSGALAQVSGVSTRLAALEMLLYPATSAGLGALVGQVAGAVGGALGLGTPSTPAWQVPDSSVPIVLFVWGPFRIVPVRVTGLTTVEKLYDSTLNPIQAEVQLKLRVLTPDELQAAGNDQQFLAGIATTAYNYTLGVRQAGAVANLGNALSSLSGIL